MNHIKTFIAGFIIACCLCSSCQQLLPQPNLHRCWFYTFQSDFSPSQKEALTPASFLCLYKDGTYTRDFGIFDFGGWEQKKGMLVLNSKRSQPEHWEIRRLSSSELVLGMDAGTMNFEGKAIAGDSPAADPFSQANNQWRVPAAAKENEAMLKKRLQNHCRFWAAYFSWALFTKQETVDVRSTPTPIKIYGNGFALKPVSGQPARWRSYFYDDEDCQKAFDILEKMIRNTDIAWAHTDNKYKMFIGAFQQLEKALQ